MSIKGKTKQRHQGAVRGWLSRLFTKALPAALPKAEPVSDKVKKPPKASPHSGSKS